MILYCKVERNAEMSIFTTKTRADLVLNILARVDVDMNLFKLHACTSHLYKKNMRRITNYAYRVIAFEFTF